jgi:hypothetical protein
VLARVATANGDGSDQAAAHLAAIAIGLPRVAAPVRALIAPLIGAAAPDQGEEDP